MKWMKMYVTVPVKFLNLQARKDERYRFAEKEIIKLLIDTMQNEKINNARV